jgi:glucose/arabinose dehydrogenase
MKSGDNVSIPDVLIQAHSASMGMIIYDCDQFPSDYSGDAFAAQHGSWNLGKRTGYKVIRARVAVAHDGALLVSEDGNGTMWRVSYRGGP